MLLQPLHMSLELALMSGLSHSIGLDLVQAYLALSSFPGPSPHSK